MLSALFALIAGVCFASAGVLQQRVAASRPDEESLSPRLLWDLAHQPMWLAGIGMAVCSYLFQALALNFGTLALVQPLIVTELIFAIPISVRLHRMSLSWREWVGAVSVAGGLALAEFAASPSKGKGLPSAGEWIVVLVIAVVLAAVALLAGRRLLREGPWRASIFAFAGAVVMGTQSATLKATTTLFSRGITVALTSWEPYVMAVLSILGLLLLQSAFQAGPLAASMPVVDLTEPTTALIIGMTIFGESVRTSGIWLGLEALGAIAAVTGILLLDTSPVVHRLQREEAKEQEQVEQGEREQPELRPT